MVSAERSLFTCNARNAMRIDDTRRFIAPPQWVHESPALPRRLREKLCPAIVDDPPIPEGNHSARELRYFIGMRYHDDGDAMSPIELLKNSA